MKCKHFNACAAHPFSLWRLLGIFSYAFYYYFSAYGGHCFISEFEFLVALKTHVSQKKFFVCVKKQQLGYPKYWQSLVSKALELNLRGASPDIRTSKKQPCWKNKEHI